MTEIRNPTNLKSAPDAETGSVYHRAPQTPRPRSSPPPPQPAMESVPAPKNRRVSNLGHAIMLSNIRTFSLVALFMCSLLGLAVYLTGHIWQRHKDRVQVEETGPPPRIRRTADDLERADAMVGRPREQDVPEARVRTELDTEAMRRAVFMQKRAEALVEAGNYDEAINRFKDALDIWPHLTVVWAQLGRAYLAQGDYRRAEIALERAVEADPGNAELLNDLGVAALYRNRPARALELFETVNDLNPRFAPAYFNRALYYLGMEDNEAAEQALDIFLRLRPNDAQALKERAYLHAHRGDYDGALTALRRAMTTAPDWVPLYVDAAAAAALLGRARDALRYLDQVEGFTSPGIVYRIYQQPAFRDVRRTEAGRAFELALAERARELLVADLLEDEELQLDTAVPMVTAP